MTIETGTTADPQHAMATADTAAHALFERFINGTRPSGIDRTAPDLDTAVSAADRDRLRGWASNRWPAAVPAELPMSELIRRVEHSHHFAATDYVSDRAATERLFNSQMAGIDEAFNR